MSYGTTIPGFKDYSVTKDGVVYSHKHGTSKRLNVTRTHYGYGSVSLRNDGKSHKKLVHRLVLETFVGPCPVGSECRHLNGNRLDNRLENLAWGTRAENERDKISTKTANIGERHGMSKLTRDQVLAIRADTRPHRVVASEYGVCEVNIGCIRLRKTWRHV